MYAAGGQVALPDRRQVGRGGAAGQQHCQRKRRKNSDTSLKKFLSLIRVVGRGGRVLPHLQRARAEAGLGLNKAHHHAHVAV